MTQQVEFFGPVDVYARREEGEWVAWADPFSTVGCGPSYEEALAELRENLEAHFSYLAEEIEKHGELVEVLCPLPDDLKRAERTAHLFVYALCEPEPQPGARLQSDEPVPARAHPRSLESLLEALRGHRELHVSPACG